MTITNSQTSMSYGFSKHARAAPLRSSVSHTCPVNECRLPFYNEWILKAHMAAEHPGFRPCQSSNRPKPKEIIPRKSIPLLHCPYPACMATFKKHHQVARHKWSHIPSELHPRCIGLKYGLPCDFPYTGRADVMRSHWNTYHLDQGAYPAPSYDSYGSALSKARQLGYDMRCPSQEGLSSAFNTVSYPSSSLQSSETASATMPEIFSDEGVFLDDAMTGVLQSFSPSWSWNIPHEANTFKFI